jgi:thiol-disulfide isomerase/thioredoxin
MSHEFEVGKYYSNIYPNDLIKLHKSGKKFLICFHWNLCGHCVAFRPELEKLASMIKSSGRNDLLVLGMEADDIPESYGINSFPTIWLVNVGGKSSELYKGKRKAELLFQKMKQ